MRQKNNPYDRLDEENRKTLDADYQYQEYLEQQKIKSETKTSNQN